MFYTVQYSKLNPYNTKWLCVKIGSTNGTGEEDH